MSIREDIVDEARSWLGTRWQHQGRVKKNKRFAGGVDCLGLILGVANTLNLFPDILIFHNYNRLPHDNLLLQECDRHLVKKDILDMQPGDVLAFRMQFEPQHLAILSEKQTMIHAYIQTRAVVENSLDQEWLDRLVAVYSYPSV
jgi:NlpC/P60 family putative phage cell wall peptidase